MKHNNTFDKSLGKNKVALTAFFENKVSDTEQIKARLVAVVSDTALLKKTLLASGVYDKDFKLTKNFKSK